MSKLTLRQIKSAIEGTIEVAFPGVTVHKTGVLNNFNRPSFFVLFTSIESQDYLFYKSRTINVDIHYFPTDRYQHTLELLDTQDELESIFGLNLAIGERTVTLDQSDANVADGVLHYSFSFTYLESKPEEDQGELMQELDYNV